MSGASIAPPGSQTDRSTGRLVLPTITVTREAKAIASVVAIVAGAGIGVFLSASPGTSRREKVLSAFLGATATLGATHTIINVLTDED